MTMWVSSMWLFTRVLNKSEDILFNTSERLQVGQLNSAQILMNIHLQAEKSDTEDHQDIKPVCSSMRLKTTEEIKVSRAKS